MIHGTRRRFGVLAGGTLAALLQAAFRPDAATARKGKKKRKCKPRCDGRECGSDRCGGQCGACDNGRTCQSGRCACPPGRVPCPFECCPRYFTCLLAQCAAPDPGQCDGFAVECTSDAACCSGRCLTVVGVRYCARSERDGLCFGNDDCVEGTSCVDFSCQ
ncbi:MAG: hypothetical protein U0031_02030 [Thermomicrobiales bacterium]